MNDPHRQALTLPSLSLPVHYFTHGRNGSFILQSPLVLGHEAGGEVVELPSDYSGDLNVGDRVAIVRGGAPCLSRFFSSPMLTPLFLRPSTNRKLVSTVDDAATAETVDTTSVRCV